MKDFWENLNKTRLLVGFIIMLVPAGIWLEGHWNQSDAVESALFLAMSNKEFYLKAKLDDLCRKYGKKRYPCSPAGMNEDDTVDFEIYKKAYEEQQRQIKQGFFQRG